MVAFYFIDSRNFVVDCDYFLDDGGDGLDNVSVLCEWYGNGDLDFLDGFTDIGYYFFDFLENFMENWFFYCGDDLLDAYLF